jgi:hypothetical protein
MRMYFAAMVMDWISWTLGIRISSSQIEGSGGGTIPDRALLTWSIPSFISKVMCPEINPLAEAT